MFLILPLLTVHFNGLQLLAYGFQPYAGMNAGTNAGMNVVMQCTGFPAYATVPPSLLINSR